MDETHMARVVAGRDDAYPDKLRQGDVPVLQNGQVDRNQDI